MSPSRGHLFFCFHLPHTCRTFNPVSLIQSLFIMKKCFLFIIAALGILPCFSQTILYQDDMETYPLNSFLGVENPSWWATWSGVPGSSEDLRISDLTAQSGVKSASIDTMGGPSDALLLLGDRFSGAYELSWQMYVETGKCGYYNIQHFESPGVEYAMQVYFRADGTFELMTGGATFYGTYPPNTWFEVKQYIDLDADYISLYINGTFVHNWPFSYQIYYTSGISQLGTVNFGAYAVSGSNEAPQCYLDNVFFQKLSTGAYPSIQLSPATIEACAEQGTIVHRAAEVSNTGITDLVYDINIIYDGKQDADSTVKLHYDGDHYISIGWSAPPVTVTVAARYPNTMTLPVAGMMLTSVEVYVDNLNADSTLWTVRIFGMGDANQPGVLLTTQSFTPEGGGWDTIPLTNPVLVTGEDLWVGYTFTQNDPGIYIPGVDAGPNNPNGDFLNTGDGWKHLSDWQGFTYNWNIRANLVGMPALQWLSVAPQTDTLGPGVTGNVDIMMNASGLEMGEYHATLRFVNNDPQEPQSDLPVTMNVVGAGAVENEPVVIMIFPNPASGLVHLKSNTPVTAVSIFDSWGRQVLSGNSEAIDISDLSEGIYLLKAVTRQGTANIKLVKKP